MDLCRLKLLLDFFVLFSVATAASRVSGMLWCYC